MTPTDETVYALAPLFGRDKKELVDHIPHCKRLGIKVDHAGPREATVRVPFSDELIGDPVRGVVFGGVITTLMDQTLALATVCSLEEISAIATLDLRIDYLRAAEPGLDLIGHARCYKLTRNVAFTRGVAYDRDIDDPFAIAVGTFMIGANNTASPIGRRLAEREDGALPDEPTAAGEGRPDGTTDHPTDSPPRHPAGDEGAQ